MNNQTTLTLEPSCKLVSTKEAGKVKISKDTLASQSPTTGVRVDCEDGREFTIGYEIEGVRREVLRLVKNGSKVELSIPGIKESPIVLEAKAMDWAEIAKYVQLCTEALNSALGTQRVNQFDADTVEKLEALEESRESQILHLSLEGKGPSASSSALEVAPGLLGSFSVQVPGMEAHECVRVAFSYHQDPHEVNSITFLNSGISPVKISTTPSNQASEDK
ncbi:MAG: hypothetical protein WC897_03275 [Candidatus Gracilibacteria bacterium]